MIRTHASFWCDIEVVMFFRLGVVDGWLSGNAGLLFIVHGVVFLCLHLTFPLHCLAVVCGDWFRSFSKVDL